MSNETTSNLPRHQPTPIGIPMGFPGGSLAPIKDPRSKTWRCKCRLGIGVWPKGFMPTGYRLGIPYGKARSFVAACASTSSIGPHVSEVGIVNLNLKMILTSRINKNQNTLSWNYSIVVIISQLTITPKGPYSKHSSPHGIFQPKFLELDPSWDSQRFHSWIKTSPLQGYVHVPCLPESCFRWLISWWTCKKRDVTQGKYPVRRGWKLLSMKGR